MKKTAYIILTSLLPVFISSCKKEVLETFNERHALYFSNVLSPSATNLLDSTEVNFSAGADIKTDSILKIPIVLLGRQFDTSQSFQIVIDPSSTAVVNEDYEWKGNQHTFPARKSSDTLMLKIFRTKKMLTSKFTLKMEIKPSAGFDIQLQQKEDKLKGAKLKLYISDIPVPPAGWVTSSTTGGYDFYFGTYSKKKLAITSLATGYSEADILYFLPLGFSSFFTDRLYVYLNRMKAAGTPVLEIDGSAMKLGPYYP